MRPAILNLSFVTLDDNDLSVFSLGLNFAPTLRFILVESMVCSVEDLIGRNSIPGRDAEFLRQDIATFLRRAKLPKPNISKSDRAALQHLRNNEKILVLPADANATVVVDTEIYEDKINNLLSDMSTYKKVNYNPTNRTTNKIIKLLQALKDKNIVSQLRPHNPTTPKIYGLPKVHKPNWPLRPIVSQIDSPTYKSSKHLAKILTPFTGKTSSYVRDSRHFVQLIKNETISETEIMVSFDVESLFTNVPVEEVVQLISKFLKKSSLPVGYLELSEFCLRNCYFKWRGDYYLQIDGVAMGSPIAPVAANMFMEWVESELMEKMSSKPRLWLRYVDDVFAIVRKEDLAEVLRSLNGVHTKVRFTMEEEKHGKLPFLDVYVIRDPGGGFSTTVYRKPTHTNRYLHATSHHHPSHLSSVPRSLIHRALNLCDPAYIDEELRQVRQALEHNGYSWRHSTRIAQNISRRKQVTVDRSPAYLPYVKGVSDKIGHYLRRKFDIRTRFRPPGKIRGILRSPKDSDPLNVPGVYMIPCDCGKSYIGETRRNIQTRVMEHIRSVKNVDTKGSAIAEHVQDSGTGHYIRFDKVSILAREKFLVPRKIREAIEIGRFPNFNRDSGWALHPAWKPLFYNKYSKPWSLECDTVSAVCLEDGYSVSDEDQQDPSEVEETPAPPQPQPPSERALRAARRVAGSQSNARA